MVLDQNERTALHTTTVTNLLELALKFFRHPYIDVNLSSKSGSTPVMKAAKNGNLKPLKVRLFTIGPSGVRALSRN